MYDVIIIEDRYFDGYDVFSKEHYMHGSIKQIWKKVYRMCRNNILDETDRFVIRVLFIDKDKDFRIRKRYNGSLRIYRRNKGITRL